MKSKNVEDILNIRPFKPFIVETDSGKKITVKHLDFFILTPPRKDAAIIFTEDGHFTIVDLDNISSISFGEKTAKR